MSSSSSSKYISPTAIETALRTPTLIDEKDKVGELQGTFVYADGRRRVIRDLTEIHEVGWTTSADNTRVVFVKHLRYATIIESDIHMSTVDKKRELKTILDQMKKWTSLRHPNILPYFGYQWKDTPILVFSWYKNGNISQYLKSQPSVNPVKLLSQVATGLMFLHTQSIVHGDIKPNNVIIADDGHPMLTDFGMAPHLRMVERNMTLADSGRENVGYMSPELIQEGNYTPESDVYALGSLILEILSGHPPYYQFSYVHAMIEITQGNKPSPEKHENLPSSSPVWDLLQRCWSNLPDDRPKVEEIQTLLERMAKEKRSGVLGYVGLLLGLPFRLIGLRW